MSNRLLSICYSTCGLGGIKSPENVRRLIEMDWIEVVIVWQEWHEANWQEWEEAGAVVIRMDGTGLSRSRNAAIDVATADFLWFQDDDTVICLDNLSGLYRQIVSGMTDVTIVRIGCLEDHQRYYKNYWPNNYIGKLRVTRISSIEIIVRRSFAENSGILFNESMGLGTDRPLGEEVVFVNSLLESGASISEIPRIHVFHSCRPDGRRGVDELHYLAKGNVLGFLKGPVRLLTLFRWVLRGGPGEFGRLRIFQLLLTGMKEIKSGNRR